MTIVTRTTFSNALRDFDRLWDRVVADRETVIITRGRSGSVAMIAADELAGLEEIIHLLRSPKNAERLLTALNRAQQRTEQPQTMNSLRKAIDQDTPDYP